MRLRKHVELLGRLLNSPHSIPRQVVESMRTRREVEVDILVRSAAYQHEGQLPQQFVPLGNEFSYGWPVRDAYPGIQRIAEIMEQWADKLATELKRLVSRQLLDRDIECLHANLGKDLPEGLALMLAVLEGHLLRQGEKHLGVFVHNPSTRLS